MEEFVGQVVGPVSLWTVLFFFTAQKCAPAWQIISLTGLQHSHRPVRPIYSAPQEELTVKETRKLVCALELLHCATPPAAWETDEEEEKSARTFHLTYCMEPSNADMFKTSSLHKGSFYHFRPDGLSKAQPGLEAGLTPCMWTGLGLMGTFLHLVD